MADREALKKHVIFSDIIIKCVSGSEEITISGASEIMTFLLCAKGVPQGRPQPINGDINGAFKGGLQWDPIIGDLQGGLNGAIPYRALFVVKGLDN